MLFIIFFYVDHKLHFLLLIWLAKITEQRCVTLLTSVVLVVICVLQLNDNLTFLNSFVALQILI